MEPKSISVTERGLYEYSDSSGVNVVDVVPYRSYSLDLTCAATIKGNFRDANPWYYEKIVTNNGPDRIDTRYKNDPYWYNQTQVGSFSPSYDEGWDDAISQAEEHAITKLYEQVRGSLDLSVDAFQAKQTAKMFHVSEQIAQLRIPKPALRKAGSLWLQYVYGWKPLAASIHAIADESIRYLTNKVTNIRIRVNKPFSIDDVVVNTSLGFPVPTSVKRSGQVVVIYGCDYEMPRTSVDRWTSLNPASIAWELCPYSFVIDWIVDVGSYLRNVETAVLYSDSFRGGFKSTLARSVTSWSGSAASTADDSTTTVSYRGSREHITFGRSLLTSTPFPSPPKLDVQLGSSRLLSAASLLSQRLGHSS